MNINPNQIEGSRPPPTKRPSTSALSVFFVMILVIVGAFVASGNLAPVDPNGIGGPPTVEPYYNSSDYPQQHIVTPTGTKQPNSLKNLQLQTFNVDNCGENSAILFVIDTSGSMAYDGKMQNVIHAMNYFVSKMGGKAVIGIDTFSKDVTPEVFLSYYKDVKKPVAQVINNLSPGGWTRTRDAMTMARDQLSKAITEEEFPGYQYNLVLLTDGVPEIPDANRHCEWTVPEPLLAGGIRCFAREQDPRYPSDVTNEIKALGVDVYTINVYSTTFKSDVAMLPHLKALLQEMSSTPLNTHYYLSTKAGNLSEILKNINNNICYDKFNGVPQTQ